MKIAISLFLATLVWFLVYPLVGGAVYRADLEQNLEKSQVVTRSLTKFRDVIDAGSTTETRTVDVDFVRKLRIAPGFRVIHDPSLNQEAYLTGPPEALDVVKLSRFFREDALEPYFTKPLRLNAPVELRLNLTAHARESLDINWFGDQSRTLKPELITKGPLAIEELTFSSAMPNPEEIEIKVDRLYLDNKQPYADLRALRGRVGELHFSHLLENQSSTNLAVTAARSKFDAMRGRWLYGQGYATVKIQYGDTYVLDQDGKRQPLQPDTIVVDPGTTVEVFAPYHSGFELRDTLVIIER